MPSTWTLVPGAAISFRLAGSRAVYGALVASSTRSCQKMRPRNTFGFKQLSGSERRADARRLDSCVDKGSSIVAEIIDLGTASTKGGFAFAAVGPAASAAASDLGRLSGNEITDEAGESL